MLTIFGLNFEIEERCKGVHCVDLGENFPTSIYLQKQAPVPAALAAGLKLAEIILMCIFLQP